jgi:MSHA biogenesis protein MshN
MSIINQALRDLEKRGVQPAKGAQAGAAVTQESASPIKTGSYWRVLFTACLFGALGFVVAVLLRDGSGLPYEVSSAGSKLLTEGRAERQPTQVGERVAEIENESSSSSDASSMPVQESQVYTMQVRTADVAASMNASDARKNVEQEAGIQAPASTSVSVTATATTPRPISEPTEPRPDQALVPASKQMPVKTKAQRTPKVPQEAIVKVSPETLDLKNASSARELVERGGHVEARQQLESFIYANSVHHASALELARLLTKMNDSAALDGLLARQSLYSNSEFRMVAARRFLQMGDASKAQQTLEQSLPPIEQYMHYYSLLASVYQKQGQYLRQADVYQRLIEVHGDRAKWWLGAAIAWDHLTQYEAARKAYQKAKSLELNDAQLMAFADQRLKQLRGY